jgi:hypothetical protein
MVESLTAVQAENIRTLANRVLSLIESDSPRSHVQSAYDLLGTACKDYANNLLYRVWAFHNSPELWFVGCHGVTDFAKSESVGIDTRLSAATPEIQEIVQAYLLARGSA